MQGVFELYLLKKTITKTKNAVPNKYDHSQKNIKKLKEKNSNFFFQTQNGFLTIKSQIKLKLMNTHSDNNHPYITLQKYQIANYSYNTLFFF